MSGDESLKDPTEDQLAVDSLLELDSLETFDARLQALEELDFPMAAIERFLESRDMRVPKKDDDFQTKVAELISEELCKNLIYQHKYAGRATINYFIITGISDYALKEIRTRVANRLPQQGDVGKITNEPFLADSDIFERSLYLPIGYYVYAGSENPITGAKQEIPITKRNVAVIQDDSDLVEIRGSNTQMVETIRDEICKSIGKYKDSTKKRPNFDHNFQEQFNELVELYYNLKVRVDAEEDTTLDTISFTSREDEEGYRKDARAAERVEKELVDKGGEITMGYVELREGFRFRMNREMAKLSFIKSEREENLNQVTTLIDNVLKETGEYSQEQISGIEDVPE